MGKSQEQAKLAVECGYWTLLRYDPRLAEQGKNPLVVDSKEPNWDLYQEFLMNEGRYAQLVKINPEAAQELFETNLKDAQKRYANYKRLSEVEYPNK